MRFLITAGGTREYIDPVRFISNASSGKMGYALARCALARRHRVTLLSAPVTRRVPAGATLHRVISSSEMFDALRTLFPHCDCLIMCAAVSDYRVARPAPLKIKKSRQRLTLELDPTPDILAWAGAHKRTSAGQRQLVCGFALEDEHLHKNAEAKLINKGLDVVIANGPEAIGADRSAISIKTRDRAWVAFPAARKTTNARRILRAIEAIL